MILDKEKLERTLSIKIKKRIMIALMLIVLFLISTAVIYFCFAFVLYSVDIFTWTEHQRFMLIFSNIVSLMCFVFFYFAGYSDLHLDIEKIEKKLEEL